MTRLRKTKILLVALGLVMVISLIPRAAFADVFSETVNVSYETAHSYLTSHGIKAEFLETMEREDVISMYMDLKDKNIGDVSYEIKGFKVIEGDAVPLYSDLDEADMTLSMSVVTTTITTSVEGKDKVVDVMPYITYAWKKNPGIKRDDKLTVNWTNSEFNYIAGSYSHKRYYKKDGSYTLFKTITAPTETNERGFGIAATWPSTNYNLMKGIIKYNMSPQGTKYQYSREKDKSKNNYATTFNANYVHNGSPVTSISFGYAGLGITIGLNDQTASTSTSGTVKYAKK